MTRAGIFRIMKAHSRSAASVSIHVRDLSQMFSSLDPSPFWDRDLDHNAADEGLIILGWISLWRPTEMLVYEWVPLVRKRRMYERLAGVRVAVRSDPPVISASSLARG